MTKKYSQVIKNPRLGAITLLMAIGIIMVLMLIINISLNKSSHPEPGPSLTFLVSGELEEAISLKDLKEDLEIHDITFTDPMYEKEKHYNAFLLSDVLNLAYGENWSSESYTDVAFEALDGYTAVSSTTKLQESGGYIVFEDLEYPYWEPISIREVNPGPFYLVWTGENQTTANGYPWPWELETINLIDFNNEYAGVTPIGALEGSEVYKGYEIFKARCIRCHAMNGEGGKIGPDMNAPQSITTYRNTYMIKEFIRNPSLYRHTHMPDHPDLSEQNLDDIIAYFKYMDEIKN
ncbi:MAG: cytochrome c [Thermodesulfobacteriota bacterium]